jgi:hypothetical protein
MNLRMGKVLHAADILDARTERQCLASGHYSGKLRYVYNRGCRLAYSDLREAG